MRQWQLDRGGGVRVRNRRADHVLESTGSRMRRPGAAPSSLWVTTQTVMPADGNKGREGQRDSRAQAGQGTWATWDLSHRESRVTLSSEQLDMWIWD